MIGGNVIGTGGFGCVFFPALRCDNKSKFKNQGYTKNKNTGVSKLMIKERAFEEYDLLEQVKQSVSFIKDFNKYFLLKGISLCKPSKLVGADANEFNYCKNFTKKDITLNYFNSNLDKFMLLTIPHAGISLRKYITKMNIRQFIELNNNMIEVLRNGILKMNAVKLYHQDIKDDNIMVRGNQPRLIDWGAVLNNKDGNIKYDGRPIQFNQSVSIVLFHPHFIKLYNEFINSGRKDYEVFIVSILKDERLNSHYNVLKNIYTNLYLVKEKNFINYIIEYLTKILKMLTINGKYDYLSYFQNVYLFNCDIYGFVMSYEGLLDWIDKQNISDINKSNFKTALNVIFYKYCFTTDVNRINTNQLTRHLSELNSFFKTNKTRKNK